MSMPILTVAMPDYGRVAEKRQTSYLTRFKQWLQLKKYQYEVTFSLYMLTSTEKIIFNLILFLLVSMLVTAASLYLPSHLAVIYNRMWYYVNGDYAPGASGQTIASAAEGLGRTSEALKAAATPMAASAKATLKEL